MKPCGRAHGACSPGHHGAAVRYTVPDRFVHSATRRSAIRPEYQHSRTGEASPALARHHNHLCLTPQIPSHEGYRVSEPSPGGHRVMPEPPREDSARASGGRDSAGSRYEQGGDSPADTATRAPPGHVETTRASTAQGAFVQPATRQRCRHLRTARVAASLFGKRLGGSGALRYPRAPSVLGDAHTSRYSPSTVSSPAAPPARALPSGPEELPVVVPVCSYIRAPTCERVRASSS